MAAAAVASMRKRGTVTPWPAPLPVPLLLLLLLAATLLATGVSATSTGEAVLRLDAGNFELAVQSYPTLAILFHEGGNGDREGREVVAAWEEAARLAAPRIRGQGLEMGFAAIDAGSSQDVADLVASYGIQLPAVQIFRRGVVYPFMLEGGEEEGGALLDETTSAEQLAEALVEEARPAVRTVTSEAELEEEARAGGIDDGSAIVVVGVFFPPAASTEEEDEKEGPVAAFEAAAEQLRGYASFLLAVPQPDSKGDWRAASPLLDGGGQEPRVLYWDYREEGEEEAPFSSFLPRRQHAYTGQQGWTEAALLDWVVGLDVPPFGRLGGGGAAVGALGQGEAYTSRFFSSALPKFIAFFRGDEQATEARLQTLSAAAETHKGRALFAFLVGEEDLPQAWAYFSVQAAQCPALVFYDPQTEHRVLSSSLAPLEEGEVHRFVAATLQGLDMPLPRSEPVPDDDHLYEQPDSPLSSPAALETKGKKKKNKKPPAVRRLVGSTFGPAIAQAGVDVMVLVTRPLCPACAEMAVSFELLGKALQAEQRVRLCRVDAQLNDLPPTIYKGTEPLPLVLLFPAKHKPFRDPPAFAAYPHPPPALQDLADFLTREGSFPPPSSSAVSSSSSAVEIGREDDDEEEEDWEGDVDGMGSQQQQRQRPLTIATIEQMGALAIDEEAIRARLKAEELHLLRNYHRLPYANPVLDKYLGEATFEGRRWHVLVGVGSLALNVLLLLMVWALQGAVKRERGQGKGREKSE